MATERTAVEHNVVGLSASARIVRTQHHLVVGSAELTVLLFEGRPRYAPVQEGFNMLRIQHAVFQAERCAGSVVELLLVALEIPPG